MISQLTKLGIGFFSSILDQPNRKNNIPFDVKTTFNVNGEMKPLYIFGDVFADTNYYGLCTLILNPKIEFIQKLIDYGPHRIVIDRSKLVNKCDACLQLVITQFSPIKVHRMRKYEDVKKLVGISREKPPL